MKIAILIPNFIEFDGGAQNARIQAEEFAREGHEVTVFTFAADLKPKGAAVQVMGMPESLFWERVYRLAFPLDVLKVMRWLPRLKGFDRIIAYYYPMTWLAHLAKKRYGVKYTFRYSGIMDPHLFRNLYERSYMRLHILLTKLTIRNADEAVSVSRFAQEELKRYTGRDSEVVHDLIDRERFHPGIDGSKLRQQLGLDNASVILSVGAIRPVKGFHLLVRAFRIVKEKIPAAKLVIVGKHTFGYYSEEVKKLADSSVVFVDLVPNQEIPYYFAMCDLYATCSLWETFNRPLAEAQACGKPAVAFNIGPHPEVAGANSLLVEPENVQQFAEACVEKLRRVKKMEG